MDFEATFDQLRTLISRHPARVYKTSMYRKQMKDYWARDDPAFAVTQVFFLIAAAIVHSTAYSLFRVSGFDGLSEAANSTLGLLYRAVLLDWLLFGLCAATVGSVLANTYLRQPASPDKVEWLFAFDIHCNAFFPRFLLIYVVQFPLLPFLMKKSIVSVVFTNCLYALGFGIYFYITHLGYRALPFLTRTEVFLYPIALVGFSLLLSCCGATIGYSMSATNLCVSMRAH